MPHTLRSDLVIEHVDNDVLILDGQSSTVHRFTGSHAEAIKHLDAGENIEAFSTELADLDAAGLLETESEGSAVSRRGVLLGGSALAGSAALAMSMPGVASAQSPGSGLQIFVADFNNSTVTGSGGTRIDLEDLSEDQFGEDENWFLRILGTGDPLEPLDPTVVVESSVEDAGSYGLRLVFELDSSPGSEPYQVRLEKGNLQSEPFIVPN